MVLQSQFSVRFFYIFRRGVTADAKAFVVVCHSLYTLGPSSRDTVRGTEDPGDAMRCFITLFGRRVQEPKIRFTREDVESTMAIIFS